MLNQSLCVKLGAWHKFCKCVTWQFGVMLQIIKGGTTIDAFQEQCFLWERGASVDVDLDLFNFRDF